MFNNIGFFLQIDYLLTASLIDFPATKAGTLAALI
jgi:hypothetical protein